MKLPQKGEENAIYLIDISSFIFRAYYSVGYLSRGDGTPVGAVYGVANMLVSLLKTYKPSHIAVAMDSKTPTFRKDIFPEYKANRPPPPDDLRVQFPMVEKLINGFGLPSLQKDGFEADDIIATVTKYALKNNIKVVLVSGDKDLMQLIEPQVVMLDTMKNKTWDEEQVENKWGVPPKLLGDLLALAGDSSDNIPGVPRVGPKTAAPALMQFGSLDALLAGRDSLKSKALAKRLGDHEQEARLSRRLVQLDESVPIELNMDSFKYEPPVTEKLGPVLDEFEFTKLKTKLLGDVTPAPKIAEVMDDETKPVYETIATETALDKAAKAIRNAGKFAVDLETTSKDAMKAQIVGIALSWEIKKAFYIPIAHKTGPKLSLEKVLAVIGPLLENPNIGVIAQNIKYEDTIFRRNKITITNVAFDPMLASYLTRPDRKHSLDLLAKEVLGRTTTSYDEVTEKSRGFQLSFDAVEVDKATDYSGEDAEVAFSLADRMSQSVEEAGASKLLFDMEIPMARVLCQMEMNGIIIDKDLLGKMSKQFGADLDLIEKRAYQVAGHEFNLASPKQLQEVLFEELALPTQKKTKTRSGYSTSSDVLEILAPLHEMPSLLLQHRTLSKLKGTYLDALPKLVNAETGRIHTSFNQAITATGRLSSSNPNLQNIPIRSELGREIRRSFIAPPGHVIISADYSQVELRILAHLSEDPELIDAFNSGADIHKRTARAIFNIGLDQDVPQDRRAEAKTVNFGVIYGKTAFGLAKELSISRTEAARFINEYFRLYQGVEVFMKQTIENAKKQGFVETISGRRRHLRDIISANHVARQQAERMARNTPIQGTAADLLKIAMIRVDQVLTKTDLDAKMILTVHDELVFEIREQNAEQAMALIKQEMENAMKLKVPLVVDIGKGNNWAQAH